VLVHDLCVCALARLFTCSTSASVASLSSLACTLAERGKLEGGERGEGRGLRRERGEGRGLRMSDAHVSSAEGRVWVLGWRGSGKGVGMLTHQDHSERIS
jgi:hypothetical protein